jgi:hypothetical protein
VCAETSVPNNLCFCTQALHMWFCRRLIWQPFSRNYGDPDCICLFHSLPDLTFVKISAAAIPSGKFFLHQGTRVQSHVKQVSYTKPVWYQWGDTSRIAERAWHSDRKGLPGSVPKMDESVGPVSTCGRELPRGWWRPIGLMVKRMIFTASVRNILDNTTYFTIYTLTQEKKRQKIRNDLQ